LGTGSKTPHDPHDFLVQGKWGPGPKTKKKSPTFKRTRELGKTRKTTGKKETSDNETAYKIRKELKKRGKEARNETTIIEQRPRERRSEGGEVSQVVHPMREGENGRSRWDEKPKEKDLGNGG